MKKTLVLVGLVSLAAIAAVVYARRKRMKEA